ncbi:MAG TPA: hypothetical protein P5170_00105 [Candidatus Syntrophosphaera sp.]|nr:hypothetical protein [Candidatus Syntrophosphaera sp.]
MKPAKRLLFIFADTPALEVTKPQIILCLVHTTVFGQTEQLHRQSWILLRPVILIQRQCLFKKLFG